MIKIYHNPRCRKSREALSLIKENTSEELEIIEYLKNTPSKMELTSVLNMLGISIFDILRKSEADYKELVKGNELSESEVINIVLEHPKLIERPIIIKGDKAVIGRPPERVFELI